jgi:hypothetical protein
LSQYASLNVQADRGRRFVVAVTPVDRQDLESSKKTGSPHGSTNDWTGNGVSSAAGAAERDGAGIVSVSSTAHM